MGIASMVPEATSEYSKASVIPWFYRDSHDVPLLIIHIYIYTYYIYIYYSYSLICWVAKNPHNHQPTGAIKYLCSLGVFVPVSDTVHPS